MDVDGIEKLWLNFLFGRIMQGAKSKSNHSGRTTKTEEHTMKWNGCSGFGLAEIVFSSAEEMFEQTGSECDLSRLSIWKISIS